MAVLPPAALPLAGRRALVVGVETPAGAAIAAAVAAAGADLALATMRADEAVLAARRLQRAAQAAGRHAATYAFDVTLGQNVKVSTRQVARELGGLDLLVSASTHYTEAPLARTGDGELAQLFAYNCYAHAFALRAAADEFARAGGGSALVVLDARAERAAPEAPAFAAAQAAALSLVRSLAAGRAPAIAVGALLVDAPPGAAAYDAASAAALGDCAVAAFAGDPAALAGALLRAQARAA